MPSSSIDCERTQQVMLEEGWRRRRWRQERKDRGKNGRSLTHERILFILFTTPQRTLLSFREISAFFFFCAFSIDFTFHFHSVTLLSFGNVFGFYMCENIIVDFNRFSTNIYAFSCP